jgi:hypothetical protein
LVVVGDRDELVTAGNTPEKVRNTLLPQLFSGKSYRVPAIIEVGARIAHGKALREGVIQSIAERDGKPVVNIKFDDGPCVPIQLILNGVPNPFLKTPVIRETEAAHG